MNPDGNKNRLRNHRVTGGVEKAQQGLADLTQSLGEESDQAEKGRKGNWEVVWGGFGRQSDFSLEEVSSWLG